MRVRIGSGNFITSRQLLLISFSILFLFLLYHSCSCLFVLLKNLYHITLSYVMQILEVKMVETENALRNDAAIIFLRVGICLSCAAIAARLIDLMIVVFVAQYFINQLVKLIVKQDITMVLCYEVLIYNFLFLCYSICCMIAVQFSLTQLSLF